MCHKSRALYVSTYEMSRTGKCPEAEGRFVAARGWGRKEWGVTVDGYEVSFGDDEYVLELGNGDRCTAL